ncbi:cytochrome P450 [Atractiella rhizophila]|nr:cytochrome P450 [Atractiella rhizophila]
MMSNLQLLAVVVGLVSHLVVKNHEPSVRQFVQYLGAGSLSLWTYLVISSHPFPEDIQQWALHLLHVSFISVQLSGIYLASLTASIVLYRLFFHRLRHIPGPFICKVTQLWALRSVLKGQHFIDVEALHKKYNSPFVRIGPNEVSIVHEDAVIDILGGKSNLPKSRQYNTASMKSGFRPSLITIKDPDEHSARRKEWAGGFTTHALKGYNEIIIARVMELMSLLRSRASEQPIDLTKWIKAWSCDVMGDLSGFHFQQMQDGEDKDGFWRAIETGAFMVASGRKAPHWIHLLAEFAPSRALAGVLYTARKLRQRFGNSSVQSKDIFHFILADKQNLTMDQLTQQFAGEAFLLMIAGADTTSGALTSLFYCLLLHPGKFKELQKAIDELYAESGVPGKDPLPHDVLASSQILEAYINEVLRLFPPLKSGQPRQIPEGGRIICGHYLPPGTTVSVPAWSMHRNRHFFSDPTSFRPERWLNPEAEDKHVTKAFVPFSYGPMNCIGLSLARQEMRILIATMVRNFDMEPIQGGGMEDFERAQKDWVVTVLGPLKVKLINRAFES